MTKLVDARGDKHADDNVGLLLTREQAQFLADVMGWCIIGHEGGRRGHSSRIYVALCDSGIDAAKSRPKDLEGQQINVAISPRRTL